MRLPRWMVAVRLQLRADSSGLRKLGYSCSAKWMDMVEEDSVGSGRGLVDWFCLLQPQSGCMERGGWLS